MKLLRALSLVAAFLVALAGARSVTGRLSQDLAADEADALHIARQDYTPPINECDSCDVGYRYCLQSGPENEKECRDNTCNLFENCKKCQLCGGPVPISPPPPSALFDKRDEGVDAATNVQCSGPCVRAHNTCLRRNPPEKCRNCTPSCQYCGWCRGEEDLDERHE